MLSVEELDLACADLARQLRHRGDIPAAELDAAVPALDAPAAEWLRYHGQLHRWLASPAAAAGQTSHEVADRAVLDALREAPVAVEGTELAVYPKSVQALLAIAALDRVLDGLARAWASWTMGEATAAERDQLPAIGEAMGYVHGLIAWAWTHPGPTLPWRADDAHPTLPDHVAALRPDQLLALHDAVAATHERLAQLSVLVDPVRREDGGARPTWAALVHSLAVETHVSTRDLLVERSLDHVLATARLEVARRQASMPEPAA